MVAACSGQRVALGVLVLLGAWGVIYELAFTVFPALLGTVVYRGIAPDVAFLVAGRVVATGTHRDLLARHPGYRETVTRGEDG